METKHDTSYGVIPFHKDGNEWKVFLIHQYGSTGDVFWTFPKGHPGAGETPEVAALRECSEETGLALDSLYPDKAFTQSYQFEQNGVRIKKTVTYFLGIVTNPHFVIQEKEVKEARWFSLAAAEQTLTHQSAQAVLKAAIAELV